MNLTKQTPKFKSLADLTADATLKRFFRSGEADGMAQLPIDRAPVAPAALERELAV